MSVETRDPSYCTVEIGGRRNLPIDSLRATRKLNAHNSDKSLNSSDGYISRIKSVIVLVIFLTSTGLIIYLFVRTSRIQEQNVILEQRLEQLQSDQANMAVANKLCIPCSELSQGPFPEDNLGINDLKQDTEDGAIVCCAKTSVQILLFLNLFAKRKLLEWCTQGSEDGSGLTCNGTGGSVVPTAYPPSASNISYSIHLQISPQKQAVTAQSNTPIRNWLSNLTGTHVTNVPTIGQNGSHDKIVVPETGIYYVYSQVGFLVYYDTTEEPSPDGQQSLFHSVFRYNVIYPLGNEELLKSGITQCWERQKDYGRYSSYVGAAVSLNKGDQLYVTVSKIQYITAEGSLTYFGMFKIR